MLLYQIEKNTGKRQLEQQENTHPENEEENKKKLRLMESNVALLMEEESPGGGADNLSLGSILSDKPKESSDEEEESLGGAADNLFSNNPIQGNHQNSSIRKSSNNKQSMSASKIDIEKYTVEEIHKAVRAAASVKGAAAALRVPVRTLSKHLGKFIYNGEPLTFSAFKNLSVDVAKAIWGSKYTDFMTASKIDIGKYTVEHIHQQVRGFTTVSGAAAALGVDVQTLSKHLGKFIYNKEPLTFSAFKNLSVDAAKAIWGSKYTDFMTASKIDIEKYTVKYIHQQVRGFTTVSDAAAALGVNVRILSVHLGKFIYNNEPLTFLRFHNLSEEEARAIWGDDYEKAMTASKIDIEKYTVKYIHQQVRGKKTVYEAAASLGVDVQTLSVHLGKFIYNKEPLTFSAFKNLSEDAARAIWGTKYTDVMTASKIDIEKYTVKYIHQQVRKFDNVLEAAASLGVWDNTLSRHLGKFIYKGKPLTFLVLSQLSEKDARDIWGDDYEKAMTAPTINIRQYTPKEIHERVCDASSLKDAAASLGVIGATLSTHLGNLGRFFHEGKRLTFSDWKKLSPQEVSVIAARYEENTGAGQPEQRKNILADENGKSVRLIESSNANNANNANNSNAGLLMEKANNLSLSITPDQETVGNLLTDRWHLASARKFEQFFNGDQPEEEDRLSNLFK